MATDRPPGIETRDRFRVAAVLREIGVLMSIEGASPFKARAFERGARLLESTAVDLRALAEASRLTELPGIGPVLAATIVDVLRTGESRLLEDVRSRLPPGVVELRTVLSLSRIKALQAALGVGSLAELEAACRAGRVRAVRGFGERTERRILDDLAALATKGDALLLHEADAEMGHVLAFARTLPGVTRAEPAGGLRRRTETTERLVVVLATDRAETTLDRFAQLPSAVAVLHRAPERVCVRLARGLPLEARVTAPERFGGALLWETGAAGHVAQLGARAEARSLSLEPDGLAGGPAVQDEEAIVYRALDLPLVPPELREGEGEVQAAAHGEQPPLVTLADLRGAVHCHTDYSDGRHTIEQMARAADALGLAYLTITDHSPAAHYANGLSVERLERQWEEIARVQERVSVRLLRGTECDILEDGSLDCPPAVIEKLDLVVASVHQRHRMDAERMTRRLVTAMRQPWFKVWGHGLGRYVLRRPPFECRLDEVLDAIAASRAAIEVNGDPHRLDLEPRWQREARLRGIRFVVSCDAHSTRGIENLRFGVDMARRAGLTRADVLNTLDVDAFKAEVRPSA